VCGSMAITVPELLSISCTRKNKPNILFIMSDDHANKAISAYDGSLNKTSNIDQLAGEGIRFENCFCTNAICAPSRAVILTGKHSNLNGHIDNSKVFDGEQVTFPKLLKQNGYQTAMIGKWHLISDPTGFDYWNILPGQGHYYNPEFIKMGKKSIIEGYVTDLITDSALDWLESRDKTKNFCLMLQHKAPHRNWMPNIKHLDLFKSEDIPVPSNLFDDFNTRTDAIKTQEISIQNNMFMDYDFKVPLPEETVQNDTEMVWTRSWLADYNRMNDEQKKKWDAAYKRENNDFLKAHLKGKELIKWKYQRYLKDYLRCIASVDENVGRVLDYLKSNNLEENTVVVYTSDQGFFLGEHGLFDKRFMYEESLKMPLIIRYPKEVKPSVNNIHLVQNLDFAPTFLDYAGIEIPEDMQGVSLRKILQGNTDIGFRDAIYFHFYEYPSIGMVKRHYGLRTERYKLIHFYHDIDDWELFDLRKDPNEMKNLYNNPEYSNVQNTLKKKLGDLRKYYQDDNEQQFMPKPVVQIDHLAIGCQVQLKVSPSEKYSGGSNDALTDGLCAPEGLNSYEEHSVWQGFEQVDLDAVIDLKEERSISSISIGCLHQINSWIFMPLELQLKISKDGKNFINLAVINNTIPEKTANPLRKELIWKGNPVSARFIHILAKNRGSCPDWHPGAGGKAWIFADEIIVK